MLIIYRWAWNGKSGIISSEESNTFSHTNIYPNFIEGEKTPQHYKPKQTEKKFYVNLEASPMVLYRLPNDKWLKKATIRIHSYARETSLLSVFSQIVKISPGPSLHLGSGQGIGQGRKGLCYLKGTVTVICDIVIQVSLSLED